MGISYTENQLGVRKEILFEYNGENYRFVLKPETRVVLNKDVLPDFKPELQTAKVFTTSAQAATFEKVEVKPTEPEEPSEPETKKTVTSTYPDGTTKSETITEKHANGTTVETQMFYYENGNVKAKYISEFDINGKKTSFTTEILDTNGKVLTNITITYDENNNEKKVGFEQNGTRGRTVADANGTHDETGIVTTTYKENGEIAVTTIYYDKSTGKKTEEIIETTYPDNRKQEITRRFDKNENMTSENTTNTEADGINKEVHYRRIKYDENNNVISDTTTISITEIETEADENGNTTTTKTVTSKDENGNTTSVTTTTTEVKTETDENGNKITTKTVTEARTTNGKTTTSVTTETIEQTHTTNTVTNPDGSTTTTDIEIDENGNVTTTVTEKDVNGKTTSVTIKIDDAKGKNVKTTKTEYKNGEVQKEITTTYDKRGSKCTVKYNHVVRINNHEDGTKTEYITNTTEINNNTNGSEIIEEYIENKYDAENNLIGTYKTITTTKRIGGKKEIVVQKYEQDELVSTTTTKKWTEKYPDNTYTEFEEVYDQSGRLRKEITTTYNADKSKNIVKKEYDKEGNIITDLITTVDKNGNKTNVGFEYIYQAIFPISSNVFYYDSFRKYDTEGNLVERKDIGYDSEGNIVEVTLQTTEINADGSKVIKTKTYDKEGNIITDLITTVDKNGNEINLGFKTSIGYDMNQNLTSITKTTYNADGSKEVEKTLYNEDGSVKSETITKYDKDGNKI